MDAFGSFYQANKDRLFGYLMRMTGDYQLSGDIMQESFTRMLKYYGPGTQNVSLLFTIARNAVLDNARKKSHRKELASDTEKGTVDQEGYLLVREAYRKVLAAMQLLEKDERDILALVVSSKLTYREIAAITGISRANVRVKIHRARVKLREILERGEK